jgi:hypothetical protein
MAVQTQTEIQDEPELEAAIPAEDEEEVAATIEDQ